MNSKNEKIKKYSSDTEFMIIVVLFKDLLHLEDRVQPVFVVIF